MVPKYNSCGILTLLVHVSPVPCTMGSPITGVSLSPIAVPNLVSERLE